MKKIGLIDFLRFSKNPVLVRLGLRFVQMNFWSGKNNFLQLHHPWFDQKKSNMYWIPVNEEIEQTGEDVVLPYEVVSKFIERSSHRVIVDFCGCRQAFKCSKHSAEIGCLMMGEDAKQISNKLSRSVSKKEAMAHLEKAVDAGLPPHIGKARVDDFIFGINNTNRLLTVCFCCECCCLTKWEKYVPAEIRNKISRKLDGLQVWIDSDKCVGCGDCVEHCYLDQILFSQKKAVISDDCRGCGRCAAACSQKAIRISLNNPDFINNTIKSIEAYVEL